MTVLQAAILGVVQGVTEFLPVSSSGHLVIFEHLLGLKTDNSLLFEIIIHLATLAAVIAFFFKDILALKIRDYLNLVIATIPAVIVGLLFKDQIENAFGSLMFVGFTLLITAGFLFFAHYSNTKKREGVSEEISPLKAFFIGIFQAAAIFPGVSRSGSTVSGAIIAKVERQKAFSFSFLMSIPAILGASVLSVLDIFQGQETFDQSMLLPYTAGAIAAFVVGLISLYWFKIIIKNMKLHYFAIYCVAVSLTVLGYVFVR